LSDALRPSFVGLDSRLIFFKKRFMGLNAKIKRRDKMPLGTIAKVQEALSSVFPGLAFRRSLTGAEKLQNLLAENRSVPEVIRTHLLEAPAVYEGSYRGEDFALEFAMPVAEPVLLVNVLIRGTKAASDPFLALLEERFGWSTTP
jgi:hypothetical protein